MGGKPATSLMKLHHAFTCATSSSAVVRMGDHDARIYISDSSWRADNFPKEALDTRVTVPDGAL
jgi:hypothetical protein